MLIIHNYYNNYFHKHHKLHLYRNFQSSRKSNINSPKSSYKGLRKAEKNQSQAKQAKHIFLFLSWEKDGKSSQKLWVKSSQTSVRIDLVALHRSLSLLSIFFLPRISASRMHDPCPYPRSLSLPNYSRKPSVPRGRFQ